MGENQSAWRSTWSVEETTSDQPSKTGPAHASISTTALDDPTGHHQRPSLSETGHEIRVEQPHVGRRNVEDSLRRRWTVANAVTDEEITDEVLIKHIDRLRRRGDSAKVNVYGGPQAQLQHARRRFSKYRPVPSPSCSLVSDAPMWQTARLALLACRELVRTERNYLSQIRLLLDGDAPTPGLVMTYVPALVDASERLLKLMLDDPSAWGIASAFVKCGVALESALVSWCGIVGGFFVNQLKKDGLVRTGSSGGRGVGGQSVVWRGGKVMVDGMRRRHSTSAVPGYPLTRARSSSPVRPYSMPLMGSKPNGKETEGSKQANKTSVRELAILPTQRVTRYVLLYRGAP